MRVHAMKQWLKLQRFLAIAAGILGLLWVAPPASAYEEDTHFIMTFVACRSAGFNDGEALTIARTDQGMDDSTGTVANRSTVIPQEREELYWHAFGYNSDGSGQAPMILDMKRAIFDWALKAPSPAEKLTRMGVFFHYQQDTWAHRHHGGTDAHGNNYRPYGRPLGHAFDGHQPDRPPFDPICALRCVEDSVAHARSFLKAIGRTPHAFFDSYTPAAGVVDTGWGDSRKGKYFNELTVDSSTPAHRYLTSLIRAQIDAYTSSFDANPNFFGRSTADEAKYATVKGKLQSVCNATTGIDRFTIPASYTKITDMTTNGLGAASIILPWKSYTVRIKTGNVSGAGTDANVYVVLYGAKRTSPEFEIDTPGNSFERNDLDTQTLNGVWDVGDINQIRLRHDNGGLGPGWFVDYVEIVYDGKTKRFNVNGWLEKPNLSRILK